MFKRMSVLVRRNGDSRAEFSQGWLEHGRLITELPGLRGYVQNHVVEDFGTAESRFLRADGFVELRFDSSDAMAAAFASPAARAMAQDEPNFLGHGSGYALAVDTGLGDDEAGHKLIVALAENSAVSLAAGIAALPVPICSRDDVVALIPKPAMSPPQPVSSFWHLCCHDIEQAREIAGAVASLAPQRGGQAAAFRVKTVRFA